MFRLPPGPTGFCTDCLTGDYPVPVQLGMDKLYLERRDTTEPVTARNGTLPVV